MLQPGRYVQCGGSADEYAVAAGPAGQQALAKAAKATPAHDGVPYVLVDGTPLADPSTIEAALCAALKKQGVSPAGCASAVLV